MCASLIKLVCFRRCKCQQHCIAQAGQVSWNVHEKWQVTVMKYLQLLEKIARSMYLICGLFLSPQVAQNSLHTWNLERWSWGMRSSCILMVRGQMTLGSSLQWQVTKAFHQIKIINISDIKWIQSKELWKPNQAVLAHWQSDPASSAPETALGGCFGLPLVAIDCSVKGDVTKMTAQPMNHHECTVIIQM